MEIKYNNYSPQLKKIFDEAYKASSSKNPMRFMINGIRFDSIMKKYIVPQSAGIIQPIDRIYDPWATETKKGVFEGAEIDIAYEVGRMPSAPGSMESTRISLGEIVFMREQVGTIESFGERAKEQLCMFLFFSNRNESNVGKDWHIPPRFGYMYHLHSTKDANRQKVEGNRAIQKANKFIDEMDAVALDKVKRGLFPNEYSIITDDEVILKLQSIASKDPSKILTLLQNADVAANDFITKIIESGLLKCEESKRLWVWGDDNKTVCVMKPGQDKFSSLKAFFTTDAGLEVAEQLEKMITKEPVE